MFGWGLAGSWKRRNLGIVRKELSSTFGKTVPPGVMFTIGSGYSIYIYIYIYIYTYDLHLRMFGLLTSQDLHAVVGAGAWNCWGVSGRFFFVGLSLSLWRQRTSSVWFWFCNWPALWTVCCFLPFPHFCAFIDCAFQSPGS